MRRGLLWNIKDLAKAAGLILLMTFPLWISAFSFWVVCSAVTSGIKTLSDDCGTRYPVEFVLGGNWFCPEKTDE